MSLILMQSPQLSSYRVGPSYPVRWSRCSIKVAAAVRKQASETSDPSPPKKSSTPAPPTPPQTSAVRFVPNTRRRPTRPSNSSSAPPPSADAKNLEFRVQEQDADLTLEDVQEFDSATSASVSSAAPYVTPTKRAKQADEQLAAEYEFLKSQQQESGQEEEEEEYIENKKALLVGLMNSGSDLPKKIEEISDEIDDTMLNLLAQRINTAHEFGQDEADIQQLLQLYSLLKTHYQRRESGPILILLDEVLTILGDQPNADDYQDRRREAQARLQSAFMGSSGSMGARDIFSAAAMLANAGAAQQYAMQEENAVSLQSFLEECTSLLAGAEAGSEQLESQIQAASLDLEKKLAAADAVASPAVRTLAQQIRLAKLALKDRNASMSQLQDVMTITQGFLEGS